MKMRPCGAQLCLGPEKPMGFPAGRAPLWAMCAAGLLAQEEPATHRVPAALGGWRVWDRGCMATPGRPRTPQGSGAAWGHTGGAVAC